MGGSVWWVVQPAQRSPQAFHSMLGNISTRTASGITHLSVHGNPPCSLQLQCSAANSSCSVVIHVACVVGNTTLSTAWQSRDVMQGTI